MEILGFQLWQLALVTAICLTVKKLFFTRDNLPPRVPGIPLLGNVHQVGQLSITHDLTKLAEKYGDLFTISLLGQDIVAVNSQELLKELYTHKGDAFLDRQSASYAMQQSLYETQGIIFRQMSPTLHHLRKKCSHAIMMVGERRQQVETLIQEEAEMLVKVLDKIEGKNINPAHEIQISMINVISALSLGKRFSRDDPDLDTLIQCVDSLNKVVTPGFGFELDLLPFLRYLPLKSVKIIKEAIALRDQFVKKQYTQLKESFQADLLRCMTDHMIEEMTEHPDGDVTETVIKAVILDMLAAGAVPVSHAMLAAIAILVNHQELQKKIHEEIDRVIGQSQVASMKFKHDMPYLQAFILESLRYSSIALSGRAATEDSKIRGYTIPKGTLLVFNLFCALHDPQIWRNPYKVDPDRFLDEDGHLVGSHHPSHQGFIPFGGGKRGCLGENFSKNRMFLFLAVVLQRFRLLPAEGEPAPIDDPRKYLPSLILETPPYKIKIVRR